ncbi:flagellar basal body P-ring protein FlgI [Xylophilus sp. Kf1]|nr:flagellar basal body P-ring protein FlgI [Xylophilus sp. Kf1]
MHPALTSSFRRLTAFWVTAFCLVLGALPAQAMRIKEVASVQGVRTNQLTGYGLVIGLDGTGDQTTQMPLTTQSLTNYMQQLGITLPAATASQLQLKNVAAVIVTAQLPAFAQPGQMIDINVSSIGNSKSLKGGTLITTPLRGVDGEIYALAQGNVAVGGAGASAGGSKVQINHLSAGRVPQGGQVERAVPTPLQEGDFIKLDLNSFDFQTARRVAEAINRRLGTGLARALDGRTVQVQAPTDANSRVSFLADLEEIPLELSAPSAKVVINARTGSIVLNQSVTLGPCAIAHGNLSITINSTPVISQPGAFSGGQTVVAQKSDIQIKQEPGILMQVPASPQLADVVRALNALGATPQDLLAILQAIKAAGALNAELEVI